VIHLLGLLVLVLAVPRATQLVVDDKIFEPVRMFFIRKFGEDGWLTYLVHCPDCTSVYMGLLGSTYAWLFLGLAVQWLVPLGLALSYVTVLFYRYKGE